MREAKHIELLASEDGVLPDLLAGLLGLRIDRRKDRGHWTITDFNTLSVALGSILNLLHEVNE